MPGAPDPDRTCRLYDGFALAPKKHSQKFMIQVWFARQNAIKPQRALRVL